MSEYALSIKQPWAALLVHGLKTIEVRRWPTTKRGRILIHAGRIPDTRPVAWAHVPPHLADEVRRCGGIVGAARLVGCQAYRDAESFTAEQALHLNDPSWFAGPVLYGFSFVEAEVLPFRACPGWFRFFEVGPPDAELVLPY